MPRKKIDKSNLPVKKVSRPEKLDDASFFSILRENAGLFARTSAAIEKEFGIKFSRQAVRERALANPEELADIQEQNLDIAEEGLYTLMRSRNERVRLQSIELYLKTQGRGRGYVQKTEIDVTAKQAYDLSKLSEDELLAWTQLQQKLIE